MGAVQASPRTRVRATLSAVHRDGGPRGVLELSGEADIATMTLLRVELDRAVRRHPEHLVVDVSTLRFCDVRCARLILSACRTTGASLTGASGTVQRVLELVGSIDPDSGSACVPGLSVPDVFVAASQPVAL